MALLDAMVSGYLAGLESNSDEFPECHAQMPAAWRHGWLNGRDDRIGRPRESADVLRRRAGMILNRYMEPLA